MSGRFCINWPECGCAAQCAAARRPNPLPLTLILSIAPIGAVAVLLWLMEII